MTGMGWPQLLQQGIQAVRNRQAMAALDLLQQARLLQPGSREIQHWLGQAQRLCGQPSLAEKSFRGVLEHHPLDHETALALAFLLRDQGRIEELGQLLVDFAGQAGVQTQVLLQLAGLLRDSNRFDDAIEVMQAVIQREHGQAAHHFRLARLYQGTGQHQAALQAYRDTLLLDPETGGAWLGLSTLQHFRSVDDPDWQLLANARPATADSENAMCLAFARAKGLDDLQLYQQAWSQLLEGNRLRQSSQPWDRAAWQAVLQQSRSIRPERHHPAHTPRKPVFIVGMLRSGTTLLEQLLDQHPGVTARGELNFLAHAWKLWQQQKPGAALAHELAGQLWSHMRQDGPDTRAYIDKNPLNFRFLPLLARLLPEAKIVHLRRDGRDSCLSCFMQLFQHPDSAFANQLDSLAEFYQGYLELMDHYEQSMPGKVFTLAYEDLVADDQACLARVMDYLELPPDSQPSPDGHEAGSTETGAGAQRPIRTASAWQARQAIHHRSVGRWKNYYEYAPGFFDRIAKLDLQFGQPGNRPG